jgi:hypothetical protein
MPVLGAATKVYFGTTTVNKVYVGTVQVWVPAAPAFDPATTAWAAAVVAAGGTVSSPRKTLVDNLIVGLKTDGVWAKLDRLWLFAGENAQSADRDLVSPANPATLINSPSFTADRGYTGNGSNAYVNSNVANNAGGLKYTQDSACFFGWSNTAGGDNGGLIGMGLAGGVSYTGIIPCHSNGNLYATINDPSNWWMNAANTGGPIGLYLLNRADSLHSSVSFNGSPFIGETTIPSAALSGENFQALATSGGTYSVRQCCAMGFGSSLSLGERTAIYNRLRTYMTAVGVP